MTHFTKLTYLPLPSWSVLKMELAFTSKTSAAQSLIYFDDNVDGHVLYQSI
jgi:hypothetical protein